MRAALVLSAMLLAAPAAAQESPVWTGVWGGRVGTYPVRLCIDAFGGPARGAYYYLSRLEPIPITEEDGEGGWIEKTPEGESSALWEFVVQTGEELRGTWRQGPRRLPFDLRPVAWSDGDWGGPCSSEAFHQARLSGGDIGSAPAEHGGWAYMTLSYRPPAHFSDDIDVETFSFAPEKPGDDVLNTALAAILPVGNLQDSAFDCMAASIATFSVDGFFEAVLRPKLVTPEFITVEHSYSNFCGGAHPNHGVGYLSFDRQTGEQIDLQAWVDADTGKIEFTPLPDGLRRAVLARWPEDPDTDPECRPYAEEEIYWSLELRREGLAFTPSMPHALTPCAVPGLLDWATLEPFLTVQGQAGLERLAAK